MNEDKKLRLAAALIQDAKDCLSPINEANRVLFSVTCDLENARILITDQIKNYIK